MDKFQQIKPLLDDLNLECERLNWVCDAITRVIREEDEPRTHTEYTPPTDSQGDADYLKEASNKLKNFNAN